jgi:hypothetical protein
VPNNRLFYACEAVGVSDYESAPDTYLAARGVQTAGVNTSFNLEQFFEYGQLAVYQNAEGVPDVEVTLEKVLDGNPLLYHLMTQGATASTLLGRSNQRCNVALGLYADTTPLASGTPQAQVVLSGAYVSQLSYEFSVNGAFKESVTAVGNNKRWLPSGYTFTGMSAASGVTQLTPAATEGVNVRQHFLMADCRFPLEIRGISSSGTNDPAAGGTAFNVAVQSVRVSTNLGRQQILELGRRAPFFRYVDFPVEVTSAIEVVAKEGDHVDALETGSQPGGGNLTDQVVYFATTEGTKLNLGSRNRLLSVNYNGGTAGRGGGNATITYSYSNQNDLDIKHPADPTTALR